MPQDNVCYVNAHISNISFPTTIEELETFVYENGRYNVEEVAIYGAGSWTVPRNAKKGDIVLFYHAKTAISRITALITQVKALPEDTEHDRELLLCWLDRARRLFKIFGGKIFSIGKILGAPKTEVLGEKEKYHWHGRIYAEVGETVNLDFPVDISEFNSFIKISRQSAITPLPGREFNELRNLIRIKNKNLPEYFLNCEIGNYDLSSITRENFLTATRAYRCRFLLEIDFRSYYVDHLLRGLSGRKFWRECACYTEGTPQYYIDNVFQYSGKYYLLEVKLNIHLERNLSAQLQQYVCADYLYLDQGRTQKVTAFERNYMYVIDTDAFYRYDTASDTLTELIRLENVCSVGDIERFLQ